MAIPRLGSDDALENFARKHPGAAVAIGVGMIGRTAVRRGIETFVAQLGLAIPVIRARSAVIAPDTALAGGTFVGDGVVVNPSVRVGRCVILNTSCVVEHDASIGDHTHISPGAVVCGGAVVGDDCWIGAGAVITQSLRVAHGCIVGAGAVVLANLESAGTYVGVPARRIG